MTTRLAALGDSLTCGEGVGLSLDPSHAWAALLAGALDDGSPNGGSLTLTAAPGARVRDVLAAQLPVALAARPDIATVLVGLNDVVRSGFDPAMVRRDLLTAVSALRGVGARVVLVRLHDPTAILWLPGWVVRYVGARVGAVNRAVDEVARLDPGVHLLDLGDVIALRRPGAWTVDRVHPNRLGHQAIAAAAADVLRTAGVRVGQVPLQPVPARGPGLPARAVWAVRYGLPWALRHSRQLVRPAGVVPARSGSSGDRPR